MVTTVPRPPKPAVKAVLTCTAAVSVTNQWNAGYQANITVQNTSKKSLPNWILTFVVPNGQLVTQVWGGTGSQSGNTVRVTAPTDTPRLPAGAPVTVGYLIQATAGSGRGPGSRPMFVSSVRLNGTGCA
jgi:cellulase/cellobiase CelA1